MIKLAVGALAVAALLAGCGDPVPGRGAAAGTSPPAGTSTPSVPAASSAPGSPGTSSASDPAAMPSSSPQPVTRVTTLAPVDRAGHAADGWQVDSSRKGTPIQCVVGGAAYPSVAAVSGNVYTCTPSSAGADACWASAQSLVMYCLLDTWSRTVVALSADQQPPPTAAVAHPVPLGLELTDGDRCALRDGGAWGAPQTHPSWVGYYSCRTHVAVWGPPDATGIDDSRPLWRVYAGDPGGPLAQVSVAVAYFVATAP